MIGNRRKHSQPDADQHDAPGGIFGDESSALITRDLQAVRDRVEQVEAQISSQFTSLATYAQIAHEQVGLARAEASAATERSEQRVVSLIERERSDRLGASGDAGPSLTERLDVLETMVGDLRHGLDQCRQQQLALAEALTSMFEPDGLDR